MTTNDPSLSSDDSFLESFRALLVEPAPEAVAAAAVGVIERHAVRRPAIPAVYDSVFEGVPIGVRGTGPRLITFESDVVSVEIEVIAERSMQIVGQVAPAAAGTVEVHAGASVQSNAVDDLGRFQVGEVASGPFRLTMQLEGRDFETDWITL
jgi:hypothetical protein